MTCTPTSSPTRRAAAAPASVAAFTDATSPRTIAVTRPASTFCQPTKTTLAAFTMASAASIMPTRPRVSTRPSASPGRSFAIGASILCDSSPRRHRQPLDDAIAVQHPDGVDEIGDDAGVVGNDAHECAGRQARLAAGGPHRRVLLRQALDREALVGPRVVEIAQH